MRERFQESFLHRLMNSAGMLRPTQPFPQPLPGPGAAVARGRLAAATAAALCQHLGSRRCAGADGLASAQPAAVRPAPRACTASFDFPLASPRPPAGMPPPLACPAPRPSAGLLLGVQLLRRLLAAAAIFSSRL